MNKVFDELWRIIIYSLISLFIVVNLLQYLNNHDWWKIEEIKGEDESPGSSSVFWFLEGVPGEGDSTKPQAEIFVHNTLQEKISGSSGFFRRIVPGQYFFLRVSCAGKIAYSPVFILKNGEVRRLNFHFSEENETLRYSGTTYRRVKLKEKKAEPIGQLLAIIKSNILPTGFLQNLK